MKELRDRIWETRKARIKLEKRILSYATLTEILVPWFSVVLIAISLIAAVYRKDAANIASIIGSISILVFSVITSSQQFRLKAEKIKEQYIELDRIYIRLSEAQEKTEIERLSSQYHELLKTTQNHSSIDYIAVMIECRNQADCTVQKPRLLEWLAFLLYKLFSIIVIIVLFSMIPIAAYAFLQ